MRLLCSIKQNSMRRRSAISSDPRPGTQFKPSRLTLSVPPNLCRFCTLCRPEQISKPPRPDVGDRPPNRSTACRFHAPTGDCRERRVGTPRTMADSVKGGFGKFVTKWIFMKIPQTRRKCRSPFYWCERRDSTRDLLRDRQRSNQLNYGPANSLKMISRSLHSLAVSCTAFHVLRRDRASFST
jgi:hypothetical protein